MFIPYGFQDASRRQGNECSQQRGNLKDNGYITSTKISIAINNKYRKITLEDYRVI
ncbi:MULTISPECIES: hypothetical protein [Photorhabdus]|uniref:hypothetical protein n=1 Tax=Photorhabdus TaxID=29487 RepID=UPI000ACFB974|nr:MULTISPECIES: hypothetical protein [Photorhabdus]NDK94075.1 hypothetical protein [Photorhabdus laumondii subsp. laumondii]NDL46646.1 hypothetical protein [Photorhabdus laumondii subsp. laumondii]